MQVYIVLTQVQTILQVTTKIETINNLTTMIKGLSIGTQFQK